MGKIAKLTDAELSAALATLPGWSKVAGREAIVKSFKLKNFRAATGFLVQVAMAAEHLDHHPEFKHLYDTVEVTMNTHDAGGVSERDVALARAIEAIAG